MIYHPKLRSLSALGGRFVQLLVLWGHLYCPLFGDRRLSVSWKSIAKSIRGTLSVRCMEAVHILESLLWEVPLYQIAQTMC